MAILESISHLEPTTSILNGNIASTSTVVGTSTTSTTSTLWAVDRDEDGNKFLNPKKILELLGTTAVTSTTISSMKLDNAFAAEIQQQAAHIGITENQVIGVNFIRDLEEYIESLPDNKLLALLESLDQKEQELQNGQSEEKEATKHL